MRFGYLQRNESSERGDNNIDPLMHNSMHNKDCPYQFYTKLVHVSHQNDRTV